MATQLQVSSGRPGSIESSDPVLLVDGSGYIYRAFFAIAPLTTKDGLPTNALLGFTRMLMKLLRETKSHKLAVVFDSPQPTFRHEMYSEYKANRAECPSELVKQMPYFRSIVNALGIRSLEQPGVEADDLIATIARRLSACDEPVVVVSGDKDLLQLVNERVCVWDAMREVRYAPEQVHEKFGVWPAQVRDYLALVGDSSDNVPGVKGVGPKTAQRLIEEFGSLAGILEHAQKIPDIKGLRGAKSVAQAVEAHRELLRLSYDLVGLKDDIEPFASAACAADFRWFGPCQTELRALFHELEFVKLLDSVPSGSAGVVGAADAASGHVGRQRDNQEPTSDSSVSAELRTGFTVPSGQTAERVAQSAEATRSAVTDQRGDGSIPRLPEVRKTVYELMTESTFPDFVEQLTVQPHFAFDTETTGLCPLDCALLGLSFAWEPGRAYFVPLRLPAVVPSTASDCTPPPPPSAPPTALLEPATPSPAMAYSVPSTSVVTHLSLFEPLTDAVPQSAAPASRRRSSMLSASKEVVSADSCASPAKLFRDAPRLDPIAVRDALAPIFANPFQKKSGCNLKFDVRVLEEQGYVVNGLFFDAMLCSYVLNPDRRQHGLKQLAQHHLEQKMVTYDELLGEADDLDGVELERLLNYACHDAEASWLLAEKMIPLLGPEEEAGTPAEAHSPRGVFFNVEMRLLSVLASMERTGILVDVSFLEKLGSDFRVELGRLEESIYAEAGEPFNLNSPKQVAAILFDKLSLPTAGIRKNQSGYSTDAAVLAKLAPDALIARLMLEYRELHKLLTTYVEALKRLVHPRTGRIHTSFNQAVAATGRLSSSDPNLQNIPIRNARGRQIRKAFVADPGFRLLSADYSQVELRVLAHLSGDPSLCEAFRSGEDIHERTARELFGSEFASDTERKEKRRVAKTINFGIIYGMSAFRLAGELGMGRRDAQKYIDEYFGRYPLVAEYFESVKANAEKSGYVETMLGRRRYIREIDTSGRDAGYQERSYLNAPIQGSAAEIIKCAMIRVHEALKPYGSRARMLLQVHDELVFEVAYELEGEIRSLVKREMEQAVPLAVPLQVDVRSGENWGEVV